MSHCLYSTALHWSATRGYAKMNGVMVAFSVAPTLAGCKAAEIDYIPEVGMRSITPAMQSNRDMTDDEVRAADSLLAKLCA